MKLVATAHGGSVGVEGREGGGSVFRIELLRLLTLPTLVTQSSA